MCFLTFFKSIFLHCPLILISYSNFSILLLTLHFLPAIADSGFGRRVNFQLFVMTLYTHQSENVAKTWALMTVFFGVIIALGWVISYYYQSPGILVFAVIFSIVMNVVSYWFSDKIVLSMAGAKPASREEYFKLYVINDPVPNAFATGRNKEHAVVAVSTGLLSILNKAELEGVIAHELSHIGNRDILISTIAVVLVGFVTLVSDFLLRQTMFGRGDRRNGDVHPIMIVVSFALMILSPLIATLLQLAISRKREFVADASGALLTRYPEGLASALEKMQEYRGLMKRANHATAHLYMLNPFGTRQKISFWTKMWSTHPPTEERIAALRGESAKDGPMR